MSSIVRSPLGFFRGIARFFQVQTDTIIEQTAAAGVTIDGCLIKDGAAAAANSTNKIAAAAAFTSTEQTSLGAELTINHGLGTTPVAWWVSPSLNKDGADCAFTRGAADATSVKVTATSGAKFYVIALK